MDGAFLGSSFADPYELHVGLSEDGFAFPVWLALIAKLDERLSPEGQTWAWAPGAEFLLRRVRFCPDCGRQAAGYSQTVIVGGEPRAMALLGHCSHCGDL
jgi:hypothetical protein